VGNKFYEYIPARSDYSTDFYTDEEDKQVFSVIEFSEDSIKGTAYQKQDPDDWNSFKAVDSYEILNNLQTGKQVTDYTDVSKNAWYYDAAKYVTDKHLMSGEKPYVFGADEALTRAEVASALYNLAGQPKVELASFTDVPVTHQARTAIAWAAKTGIMKGVGDNKFEPDRSVSREEIATLLTRQRKLSGEDVSADKAAINEFADSAKISSWAVDGVAYCTKSGLVKGNPGKVFAPAGNTTRAELATIIQRIAA
ncbi:MAG: S-layer homology domain-containing protein, partial [Butyricicoccus sp.]|nr:S-layer homology domain-containing protein [Butyricicoccus sp.]